MHFVSDPVQNDPLRIPKGPTPNRYTPHQGKREIARRLRKASTTPDTDEGRAVS